MKSDAREACIRKAYGMKHLTKNRKISIQIKMIKDNTDLV
jgi:hypothetical protein